MLIQICLVMLVMTQPDILPPAETDWLDDPNTLATLFIEWDDERPWEPYLSVLARNWGLRTRVRTYPKYIDGEWYSSWVAPYSWVGDLNHDGIVNLKDLAILAKFFKGRFTYTPPPPIPIPPSPPRLSRMEAIARIMNELFMTKRKE